MKIKSFSPSSISKTNGYQCRAKLTTDHYASSYGQPVLVRDDGEALGAGDAILADYRIVTATPKERQALAAAGYILPDASTTYDFQKVIEVARTALNHHSDQRIGEELVLRGLTPPGGGTWHVAQIRSLCLMIDSVGRVRPALAVID